VQFKNPRPSSEEPIRLSQWRRKAVRIITLRLSSPSSVHFIYHN